MRSALYWAADYEDRKSALIEEKQSVSSALFLLASLPLLTRYCCYRISVDRKLEKSTTRDVNPERPHNQKTARKMIYSKVNLRSIPQRTTFASNRLTPRYSGQIAALWPENVMQTNQISRESTSQLVILTLLSCMILITDSLPVYSQQLQVEAQEIGRDRRLKQLRIRYSTVVLASPRRLTKPTSESAALGFPVSRISSLFCCVVSLVSGVTSFSPLSHFSLLASATSLQRKPLLYGQGKLSNDSAEITCSAMFLFLQPKSALKIRIKFSTDATALTGNLSFRRECNHLCATNRSSLEISHCCRKKGRSMCEKRSRLTVDKEVGSRGVSARARGEVEEGTLELLDVTLATENGLAVDRRENLGRSSHRSLEESGRDRVDAGYSSTSFDQPSSERNLSGLGSMETHQTCASRARATCRNGGHRPWKRCRRTGWCPTQ